MKYVPSVLLGRMSGKAGSVVFSVWRGIVYIRQHVIPSNPQTAAQVAQRAIFAQIVSWYHVLTMAMRNYLDYLVLGQALAGFNAFMSQNVKDLVEPVDPRIFPTSTDIDPITTVVASTGGVGEITVVWDVGDAVPTSNVVWFCCPFPAGVLTGEIFIPTITGAVAGDEAETISGLENGLPYQCFGFVQSADDEFSVAVADDATSGAP